MIHAELNAGRVTRLATIARFREDRLGRRAPDLAERQQMMLDVAERLATLMGSFHDGLSATRQSRAEAAAALHDRLDSFASDLSAATRENLSRMAAARAAQAETDRAARADFLTGLRADVERIVSEDFGLAAGSVVASVDDFATGMMGGMMDGMPDPEDAASEPLE